MRKKTTKKFDVNALETFIHTQMPDATDAWEFLEDQEWERMDGCLRTEFKLVE